MKATTLLLIAFIFGYLTANAQEDKSKRLSPPARSTGTRGDLTITVNYSNPVKPFMPYHPPTPYASLPFHKTPLIFRSKYLAPI